MPTLKYWDTATSAWKYLLQGPKGDTGATGATGPSGAGSGDMVKATYDPTSKVADAFSQDNMADGTTNKNYSATDKTRLATITDASYKNSNTTKADVGLSAVPNTDFTSQVTANNAKVSFDSTSSTRLAGTSGTNTGDETTSTIKTKLGITTLSGTNTGDQTIPTALPPNGTASGDLTGTYPSPTVAKINGTALSGLSTGILKNTTGTGVPTIAVAADFPTLNQSTTGSAAKLTTAQAINGVNFDGSAAITIVPRIGTTTSTATPSITITSYDQYNITALAVAITGVTMSGTAVDGQKILIRIKDNGTARAITWGSSFISSGSGTLLTTTAASKTHLSGFIYDATVTKWVCMAADATGY